MTRTLKEIAFSTIALFCLMTLLQTKDFFFYFNTILLFKIFVLGSLPVIILWMVLSVRDYLRRQGIIYYCVQKFRSLDIPKAAKIMVLIVLAGNLVAISFGTQRYPFYDVGMFRWPKDFVNRDKIFHEVKYYYWDHGQYKILELRKEGSFFLADHFEWGYTHDFAYATAYFHKGEKENFQFLSQAMKQRGVDTLWVGVHTVNYETREVTFNPDICNAIKINQTAQLYYGPIYIPEYQKEKCNEH